MFENIFSPDNTGLKNRMRTAILKAKEAGRRHEKATGSKEAGKQLFNSILSAEFIKISKDL